MLRRALTNQSIIAAFGPIYNIDPAAGLMAVFHRTAHETGWSCEEDGLVPDPVLDRARNLRTAAVRTASERLEVVHDDLVDWARAGLVLEVARRHGIHVIGRGILRPNWRLNGTVTGRFGCESTRGNDGKSWSFNPLSIGPDDRMRIRPSDACRNIAVLDFSGMDVCSMISIVPGLSRIYDGSWDMHQRTADLTGLPRHIAKQSFLAWAYGSSIESDVMGKFNETFVPIREFVSGLEHGDFPRMVQMTSAVAFRAALSRALPLLVSNDMIPMFSVHDELTIDCSDMGLSALRVRDGTGEGLADALESGASKRIGVPYHVNVSVGYTYEEAKNGH